jgi:Type ISP C-terminal specificity domain
VSQVLINQYLGELDRLKKVGGTHRESVVREAFKDLLKGWGRQHDLTFIPEYKLDSATKDAKDDLDEEIAFKFKRGYPQDNIIFEDSTKAVLIQHRDEVMRCDVADVKARAAGQSPKPTLKANKDAGTITLDSETTLAGVPPDAWRYQLGNRCAIDWVLDQYKEKKPKDPTIREKFDTYRFADYKGKVIDLLARVTTVSVETMKIVDAMREAKR